MTITKKRGKQLIINLTMTLTTAAIILALYTVSILTDRGKAVEIIENTADINTEHNLDVLKSKTVSFPEVNFTNVSPKFIVKLYSDELRLISSDLPNEYTTIKSIDPRTLRESDRLDLEKGIELESEEELMHFLEDFGS